MPTLLRTDADRISRQMEIGSTLSLEIDGLTRKVQLDAATEAGGLGLHLPGQVEVLAQGAGCYLYQGGAEVLEAGWTWPAANARYRLLANERRVINLRDAAHSCLAVLQLDVSTGTAVVTETRAL